MEREHREEYEERRRRRHRRRGRKERILHTRVSDALADDIRRMADDLRVPASNLVRNVLEEVFTVVESVTDDVGGLFDDLLDEAEAVRDRIRGQRRRRDAAAPDRESGGSNRDRAFWHAAYREVDDAEVRANPPRSAARPNGPPPPPVDWHVVEQGRSVGPFRPDELAAAVRAGRVVRETPVWCAGMSDWCPAGQVAALESLFRPPPPPPPPAAPDEAAPGSAQPGGESS